MGFFGIQILLNSISDGAPPQTRPGSLWWEPTMLPRPPSQLGRGIPAPHSSPPRRHQRLAMAPRNGHWRWP